MLSNILLEKMLPTKACGYSWGFMPLPLCFRTHLYYGSP